ncbi:O-methyltransferase-domain-containing protein [Aspergillus tamarii]|uniref:O-methyltransferase-domain-containing protein n=1 Tax=Aspergillus tamarii TaxID=41984 RepID=A0A5N6UET8_ASPTM|nr:O-methyltransferase-domain-containing protein [Aspergillus tamarii]
MSFTNLIQSLNQAASALSVPGSSNVQERNELREACQRFSACLETPVERLLRTSSGCIEPAILRLAIDIGVFSLLNEELEPDTEIDVSEIAARTKTDHGMMSRLMRFLIMLQVVDVTPQGRCKATAVTRSFKPGTIIYNHVVALSGIYLPLFGRLPTYLRENQYRPPDDAYRGLFQDGFKTDLHFFDWLDIHKQEHDAFHGMMEASASSNLVAWTQYIPREWFEQRLTPSKLADGGFTLVDTASRSSRKLERMSHNFFHKQPVRGADIYLLARILHDWPDKQAREILSNLREAMDSNSTLLVYDRVFGDQLEKVSAADAIYDAVMMAFFSSLERSEAQFRDLLSSVGLRLCNIWRGDLGSDGDKQAVLEIVREE